MKVESKKLDSLIPYGFNNRIHSDTQIERIARSIKEFGFNQPIVVDEDNIILAGHGRLEAAKKLGLETAPTVKISGLSKEKKKAYRILDNKLQNDSEWNFENVELELKLLEESGFELEPWGLGDLLRGGAGADELEPNLEPSGFNYQEQFGVIVVCNSSAHQEEVYNELTGLGHKCKVVNT